MKRAAESLPFLIGGLSFKKKGREEPEADLNSRNSPISCLIGLKAEHPMELALQGFWQDCNLFGKKESKPSGITKWGCSKTCGMD